MAKQYELTAGQVWGLKQMFAQTSAQNDIDLSRRLSLIAMLDFTAEEREQIEFLEIPGPVTDETTFIRDAVLTRRLTKAQRKKILDTCKAAMPRVNPTFFDRWVYPAMLVLGYKLPDPDWEEDEDE